MKRLQVLPVMAVCFFASSLAGPAHANWFKSSGAMLSGDNHYRLLGSAPGPRQDDLKCIGDTRRPLADDETCDFNPKSGHFKVRKLQLQKPATPPAAPIEDAAASEPAPKSASVK